MNRYINVNLITYTFFLLFPIIPWYYEMLGINVINIFCLLYLFLIILINEFKIKLYKNKNDILLSILLFVWLISRSISLILYGNIIEIIWIIIRTIALYNALLVVINSRRVFINVIKCILISSFFVAVLGIVEAVFGYNLFSVFKPENYVLNYNPPRFGFTRILGFAEHTIVYGVYIMFCLGLNIYIKQFINKKYVVFNIILTILLWTNLLLTLSRSIIICTVLSQILILYFIDKKNFLKRILRIILIGIASIIILCILIPRVESLINNLFYMILAVFDSSYSQFIYNSFGSDNLNAQGDRLHLYNWVFEKMNDNWIFGNGMESQFSYSYIVSNDVWTWWVKKESIEVQYLDTLYRYGIICAISELLIYFRLMVMSLKNKCINWESRISFNYICFSIVLSYFIQLFAVNQTSERSLLYLIVILYLIYNQNCLND